MTTYTTWADLDDSVKDLGETNPPLPVEALPKRSATADELAGLGVTPELLGLLRQKEELEQKLKAFAGESKEPEDPRRAKCFPVKVHTKESRIEERRLKRRDEQLASIQRRLIEQARAEQKRTEQAAFVKQRNLEIAHAQVQEFERRQQLRRRALEQVVLDKRREDQDERAKENARREAERLLCVEAMIRTRRDELAARQERMLADQEAMLQRWETELRLAAAKARQERVAQDVALKIHERIRRTAVIARISECRRERREIEQSEQRKRDAERRLRGERIARSLSQQRHFEASRERAQRAKQGRA